MEKWNPNREKFREIFFEAAYDLTEVRASEKQMLAILTVFFLDYFWLPVFRGWL